MKTHDENGAEKITKKGFHSEFHGVLTRREISYIVNIANEYHGPLMQLGDFQEIVENLSGRDQETISAVKDSSTASKTPTSTSSWHSST